MKKLFTLFIFAIGFTFISNAQQTKFRTAKGETVQEKVDADAKKAEKINKIKAIEAAKAAKKTISTEEIKTISLFQIEGQFTQKTLTVPAGTYMFEIFNKNVNRDVGFVLVPKGKDAANAANHIKEAYVTSPVAKGQMSLTNKVTLAKGEYVYFCPLNGTPKYTLVVK